MSLPPCFADRREAGQYLGRRLAELGFSRTPDGDPALVLALPRGGVPVAHEVALAIDGTLDILLVRKIGAPGYPELALGAVVEGDASGRGPHTVINDDPWARRAEESGAFDAERGRQLGEICRRQQRYREGRPVAAMALCRQSVSMRPWIHAPSTSMDATNMSDAASRNWTRNPNRRHRPTKVPRRSTDQSRFLSRPTELGIPR